MLIGVKKVSIIKSIVGIVVRSENIIVSDATPIGVILRCENSMTSSSFIAVFASGFMLMMAADILHDFSYSVLGRDVNSSSSLYILYSRDIISRIFVTLSLSIEFTT